MSERACTRYTPNLVWASSFPLIGICSQQTHRADQIQGQWGESWRMYKQRKTKIIETWREQTREYKRCHRFEEIWSDIAIWFAAKLDGNVCGILEDVVVRFAEYRKKKMFKACSGSAKIKIHKVLHDTLYSSIWPKMQSILFSFSTLCGKRKRNYKVASISLYKLWCLSQPCCRKGPLNEWIGGCNRSFQCPVIYMTLSFCTFSFQNCLYMAVDVAFIVRWNLIGIVQTCRCTLETLKNKAFWSLSRLAL